MISMCQGPFVLLCDKTLDHSQRQRTTWQVPDADSADMIHERSKTNRTPSHVGPGIHHYRRSAIRKGQLGRLGPHQSAFKPQFDDEILEIRWTDSVAAPQNNAVVLVFD